MRRRHGFSWRFSSSVGLELRTGPRHSQHHDTSPSWACAHAIRSPPCEKSFKYRLKSITQRSLTEIDPSRKSAAARKNLFLGNGFLGADRSEEHTSELQSRFGISYAVFCLKK